MKTAIIFAGGFGTRLQAGLDAPLCKPLLELNILPQPKCLIDIIIEQYIKHGFKRIIVCGGHLQEQLREHLFHKKTYAHIDLTLLDTGISTLTGGRLFQALQLCEGDDIISCTYGDGVADINLTQACEYFTLFDKKCQITTYPYKVKYGVVENGILKEKPVFETNIGYTLFTKYKIYNILAYLLEKEDPSRTIGVPFETLLTFLSQNDFLGYYQHTGYFFGVDSLRDKEDAETFFNNK